MNKKFETKKVQVLIYSFTEGCIKCLCLKRNKKDGGFWHVLTGTLEDNEKNEECIKREVNEELGFVDILSISAELKEWVWIKDLEEILVIDFVVCINKLNLILNNEHTEYCWLSPKEAYAIYEKESAKEMLLLLKEYLFYL